MEADQPIPPDTDMLIFPAEPTPGAIGAFAKFEELGQIRQLEEERLVRVWEVRAYLSDHAPLAWGADAALTRPGYHLLQRQPERKPVDLSPEWGAQRSLLWPLRR